MVTMEKSKVIIVTPKAQKLPEFKTCAGFRKEGYPDKPRVPVGFKRTRDCMSYSLRSFPVVAPIIVPYYSPYIAPF